MTFTYVANEELESVSESELEVWDEDDEGVLCEEFDLQVDDLRGFDTVPTSTRIQAMWIINFQIHCRSVEKLGLVLFTDSITTGEVLECWCHYVLASVLRP